MKTLFHLSSLAIYKYNKELYYIPPSREYLFSEIIKSSSEKQAIKCPVGYPFYNVQLCCIQSELFERIIECHGFGSVGEAIWVAKIISHTAARFGHLDCCYVFNIKTLKIASLYGHLNIVEKFLTNEYGNTCPNEVKFDVVRKYCMSMSVCKYLFPIFVKPTTSDLERLVSKNLHCAIYISTFVGWTSFCGSYLALRRKFHDLW